MNSKFQKKYTYQNSFTLDSYQPVSSETSQKTALNESYTISNNSNKRKKLHVIPEETFELSKSLDSDNFSYSCNTSGLNLNDITYHEIKSSASIQVNEISFPNSEVIEESDLVESDESLGILPLAVLEDMTLDSLIPDKPSANLNTTLDNVGKGQFISYFSDNASILPLTVLASDSIFTDILSPIYIKPNVCFSRDQSQESPVQNDESFPKFASTPKHETNFLDLPTEIVETLNNMSSEFYGLEKENERLAELNLKDETHIKTSLCSIKPLSECVEGVKNLQEVASVAENFPNAALTYPNEYKHSSNELCFENRHRVCEKSTENVEILNTTYEKLDISPDLNESIETLQCSKQSVIAVKENIKNARFAKKNNKDKNVSVAALNLSFTKEKSRSNFDRGNRLRKSVGCFGASNTKVDINKKQVRRNSLTNNVSTPNGDFPKIKIMTFSHSKPVSFKCPAKTKSSSISGVNQKISDWSSDLNKSNTIYKRSTLKSESSNHKIGEVKSFAEVKLQQNRENLLNETICLASDNQSCVKSSVVDHENLVGFDLTVNLNENIPRHLTLKADLPNQRVEENLIPKVKLSDSQEHLLNATISLTPPNFESGKTTVKKSRNSINFSLMRKNNLKPNKNVEENLIPKAKLPDSQEHFLNQTINFTPPSSEIGKTIVKKPRNSINFSLLRKNNLENCEKLHGKNKTAYENDTIPSKQKRRRSFSITQNKKSQVNDINMFNRTLKKPSVANAVAVNEKNNIARLHDKHFSEKNTHTTVPLSEVNHNRPGRQYSAIPACKPVCVTKKRANDIPISRKSVNEVATQSKDNLNETIILPGSETDFKQNTAAPKYTNTNQEASKLPVSKIPSAQVRKIAQVKTGIGFLPSTSQSSNKQEKSSHRMIPRSISSTHKIKSPRYNCK